MSFLNTASDYAPVMGNPATPSPILHKNAKACDFLMASISNYKYIIVSEKFYEFLGIYIKELYQNWKIKVYNSEIEFDRRKNDYIIKDKSKLIEYDYRIVHISYPITNFIDYSKTTFRLYKKTPDWIFYDKATFLTDKQILFNKKMHNEHGKKPTVQKLEIIKDNIKFDTHEEFQGARKELEIINKNKAWNEKIGYKAKKVVFNTQNIEDDIFRIMDGLNNTMGYYVSERLKNEIEKNGFTGFRFIPLDEINTGYDIEII